MNYYYLSDYSQARKYSELNKSLSSKNNYPKGVAYAYNTFGILAMKTGKFDSALYYHSLALSIREEINDARGIASSNINLGYLYRVEGKFDSSVNCYQRVIPLARKINDSTLLSKSHSGIGDNYLSQSNYSPALQYYLSALNFLKGSGDKKMESKITGNIGLVFSGLGNQKEALRFHHKAIELKKQTGEKDALAYSFENIGDVFLVIQQYDSALYYFKESVTLCYENGNKDLLAKNFDDISGLFLSLQNPDSALFYNATALTIQQEIGDEEGIIESQMNEGNAYLLQAHQRESVAAYKHAVQVFESALAKAKYFGLQSRKMKMYQSLAEAYAGMKNFSKAYEYQMRFTALNDSLKNETFSRQIAEMETKYESEKKDQKISLLNVDNALTASKVSRQRIIISGLTVIALLILLSGLLIFRNIQKKRRAESQLALFEKRHAIESVRSKISIDIHDDIGSAITKVGMLAQQLSDEELNETEKRTVLQRIRQLSVEVTSGLREIIWAANPQHDTLKSFLGFSQNFIHKFFEGTEINYQINFPNEIPEVTLHPELKRNLFLTLKESLNNVMKHSKATEAVITFTIEKNNFHFSISDNGIGFSKEIKNAFGNGLTSMHKRMENIGAYLQLSSSPDQGTQIIINGNLY